MGKLTGYILLIAGLAIICFSIYLTINVFTGKTNPPEIFKIEKKVDVSVQGTDIKPVDIQTLRKELQKMLESGAKEIIPMEPIMKLLNLITFSVFTSVLIFAGAQVSGLGIKLIKNELS